MLSEAVISPKGRSSEKMLRSIKSQPTFLLPSRAIPEQLNQVVTTQTKSESISAENHIWTCKCCEHHVQLAQILRDENNNIRQQNEFLLEAVRGRTQIAVTVHERDMQIIRLKETVKALQRENNYIVADLKHQMRQLELKLGQSEHQQERKFRRELSEKWIGNQENQPTLAASSSKKSLNHHLVILTAKFEDLLKVYCQCKSSPHKKQKIRRDILQVASEIKALQGTENA